MRRVNSWLAPVRALPPLTNATLAMYGGGALLLILGVITWEPGKNPRWVIVILAAVAFAFFLWTAMRGSRFTATEALVMSAVKLATIGCLTYTTDLALAAYANGSVLLVVGLYAVWFLRPVVGRTMLYTGTVWWFVAILHHGSQSLTGTAISYVIQTVIAVEVFSLIKRRMDLTSRTDHLTGTLNRWGIDEVLHRAFHRAQRRGQPLAVVAVDLDGLREVNNAGGHQAGDQLIEAIAAHWMSGLRRGDLVGRTGGDEFLFVLPGTTKDQADMIVRRLATNSPSTWSAGVAVAKPDDTVASLLERADRRMYVQKASRRAS